MLPMVEQVRRATLPHCTHKLEMLASTHDHKKIEAPLFAVNTLSEHSAFYSHLEQLFFFFSLQKTAVLRKKKCTDNDKRNGKR